MALALGVHAQLAVARKILGVERGATTSEIKTAYRSKAKVAHPDKGGSVSAFQSLHNANELLLAHASPEKPCTDIVAAAKCTRRTVQLIAISHRAVAELQKRLMEMVDTQPAADQQRAIEMIMKYGDEYFARNASKRQRGGGKAARNDEEHTAGEFGFTGPAGTGKSKLVGFLLLRLGYSLEEIAGPIARGAMTLSRYLYDAPTVNKKCKRTSCGAAIKEPFELHCFKCKAPHNSCSCGKFLLSVMCADGCGQLSKDSGKCTLQFKSNTRVSLHDYVVMDEYSMCGDDDANELRKRASNSVIVPVGDPNQLPPVMQRQSGFPNCDNLPQELTEPKRQAANSRILMAASELVKAKASFTPSRFSSGQTGIDILKKYCITVRTATKSNDWADVTSVVIKLFAGKHKAASLLADLGIICGRHDTRRGINDALSISLGFTRSTKSILEWNNAHGASFIIPAPTMRLVVTSGRSANVGVGFKKYDILIIKSIRATTFGFEYYKGASASYDGWVANCSILNQGVEKGFCKIIILADIWAETTNGTKHAEASKRSARGGWYATRRDIPNTWFDRATKRCHQLRKSTEYKAEASRFEHDFLIRNKRNATQHNLQRHFADLGLYSKRPEYELYMPFTLLTYAIDVDIGYATTCHAAQGGEYKQVIVMAEDVSYVDAGVFGPLSIVYKWGYTALTRARDVVFVYRVGAG